MPSKLDTKLTDLKNKAVVLEVKEVEKPVSAIDVLDQFKSASGGYTDVANEFIVDVFPNFIPILCYVMMIANRAAVACDYKTHAKASPPSIIGYYVTLVYGYFLVSDCFVRPTSSIHARIWKTDSTRYEFLTFLMSLPVPEDLVPILSQFAPACTERTKNVFFIPSFAGFEHFRFFGRFIPVKCFFDIHNTVAAVPGNSPAGTIFKSLFKRAVAYTITSPAWSCNLGDILGMNTSGTNDLSRPATRLFQVFENIFNPVLFRDFHRRSSLANIPAEIPEFDNEHYNPYDALLSFTSQNGSEFETVFRSIASILKGTVTMKQSLSQVVAASSGISICMHGYSVYGMPTWSYNKSVDYTKIDKDTELAVSPVKDFCKSIGYLQKAAIPKADQDVPPIQTDDTKGGDTTSTNPVTTGQFPKVTVHRRDKTEALCWPYESDFILFDPTSHVAPLVRVLDVNGTGTATAYLATLCGKVIESFELDGQTVPVPNTDLALGLENSHFADSALPIINCISAASFDHDGSVAAPRPPIKRKVEREDLRFPASHILRDRTQIWIPYVNQKIRDPIATFPASNVPYNGFTHTTVNWLRAVQSFIGFRTIAPDASTSTVDKTANTPKAHVYAWSPYTFTSKQDSRALVNDSSRNRIYFLMNLRTLFGTDVNMVQINGYAHAMPAS